jgi:hypothetical protein
VLRRPRDRAFESPGVLDAHDRVGITDVDSEKHGENIDMSIVMSIGPPNERKAAPRGAAFHQTMSARGLDAFVAARLSAAGQKHPGGSSRNPVDHHLTGVRVANSDQGVTGSTTAAA